MLFLTLLNIAILLANHAGADGYKEKYRSQAHFSPPKGWMNDLNGLVFYDDEYHMFFQYHLEGNVLSDISWGYA